MIKIIGTAVILIALSLSIGTDELYSQEFETGEIGVLLSQWGRVGIRTPDLGGDNQINRASLVVGVSENELWTTRRHATVVDAPINIVPPTYGDYELYGSNDASDPDVPEDSPDILISHYIHGWDNKAFTLVRTTVENREPTAIDAYIALEIIPQIDGAFQDEIVEYISDHQIVDLYKDTHVGFKLLSSEIYSFKAIDYYGGYWNDLDVIYSHISSGELDSKYDAPNDGAIVYIGQDQVTIEAGEYVEFYYAIGVGTDRNSMVDQINEAQAEYDEITSIVEQPGAIPGSYLLAQNYPNPFNPTTTINFGIPTSEYVTLIVYNVVGQRVAELVSDELNAGEYSVTFDGTNLPSGVYFYSISAGSFKSTKQMMLVK